VSVWPVFGLAARAAVWRPTRELELVGLPSLLGWAAALAVVRIALEFTAAGSASHFNPYGLNAVVTWLAVELAVAALFVRPAARATALSAMFVLSVIADLVAAAVKLSAALIVSAPALNEVASSPVAAGTIFAIQVVWWLGAMMCVLRSLEAQSRLRLIGRVAALWAALFVANALVPDAPVFVASGFDIRNANWWEFLHARYAADAGSARQKRGVDVAHIEQAQPALLGAEVSGLAPQRKGVTDIYAIGIAGWADQDVFVKELDGGLATIGAILPIKDRTVRLINHADTIANVPLANLRNFTSAVHDIGNVMDKDEDVLVVLMTSHGDKTGFGLQLPGKAVTELTPQQVASTLDSEGIKNRVVIVSACYAGIFLPPLANDDTIVMTAADENSTSFGCAPERDWTYFGDALFKQSLQPGADFQHAFEHARMLIQGWELMDRAQPSNPQGHFGTALVSKLAPFFAAPQSAEQ
jgi:hypothetical protein